MRKTTPILTSAILAGAGLAGSASAAFMELDAPITLDERSSVRVELVGAWAGAAGDVYFLGSASGGTLDAAVDTGLSGLGLRLFHSKDAPGASVDLGVFDAGETLHFGYHITKGWGNVVVKNDVMRSDLSEDFHQFGWDPSASSDGVIRLGMEDIRHPKKSDWDYQDAVFDVFLSPVVRSEIPSPGSAALLAIGGAFGVRRRRR